MVWIWAWPSRSITLLRSEPPARSQEAWAWRRSWMPTLKSMPVALTAGSRTWVRKLLREIGVPTFGGEEQVVASDLLGVDVLGHRVEPVLADAKRAWLVVLGVRLEDEPF